MLRAGSSNKVFYEYSLKNSPHVYLVMWVGLTIRIEVCSIPKTDNNRHLVKLIFTEESANHKQRNHTAFQARIFVK